MTSGGDRVQPAAARVWQLAAVALCGSPSEALAAAKELADGAGRDLLAALVAQAREQMTDAEIGRALGVTGHAVTQRFPPAEPRRRGRRR